MASSGMLRRVALVRTDISEGLSASFIRVTRICELGETLAVTSVRRLLGLMDWSKIRFEIRILQSKVRRTSDLATACKLNSVTAFEWAHAC
jgi:hypothetical protein